MPRLRGAVWLLGKVGWPRSLESALTMAALMVAVALLSVLAMATVAAPQVMHAVQARFDALEPQTVGMGTGEEPLGLRSLPDRPGDDQRLWQLHRITRQYYSAEPRAAHAVAGVATVPKSGTYYASPDLQKLIETDSVVAGLFANLKRVGTITDRGLAQPHELRAVIGVARSTGMLDEVTGFGVNPLSVDTPARSPDIPVMIAVLAIIWIPGAVLLVVAVRLAGRRRLRRARALRLLGLSRFFVRMLGSAEAVAIALPAAVLGTSIYRAWVHGVTRVPGTDWGYFPADADPGFGAQVCVVLGLMLLTGLLAVASAKERAAQAARVSQVASTKVTSVGLSILVIGVAYGLIMQGLKQVSHEIMQFLVFGMWASDALMAIGLALAGPHLVGLVFRSLARHVRSGGTLAGVRSAASGSSTSLRLGALVSVLVVLFVGMLSFFNLLQHGGQTDWSKAIGAGRRVPVMANDESGQLSLSEVRKIAPRSGAAMAVQVPRKGDDLTVVFADCADLQTLAGSAVQQCGSGPTWLTVDGALDGPLRRPGPVKIPGLGTVELPQTKVAISLPENMSSAFDGAILLRRERADHLERRDLSATYFMILTSDDLSVTLARLSAQSPGMSSNLGDLSRFDPDDQQFFAHTRWMTMGVAVALLIGALALAMVVAGEAQERRTTLRGLTLLGAPVGGLWTAHFWSAGMPVMVLGWAGALIGLVAAGELYAFDQRARVEFGAVALIALVVSAVGLAIAAITFPSARRGSMTLGG